MNDVNQLARLAADAEPPALDELAARRMVDRALASAVRVAPMNRSRSWWLPAIALGVAAAVLGWRLRPMPPATPQLLHLSLPTGDRLVGLDGTRFDVARVEPADRRVTLRGGTLLADVAHVARGQRFAISTAHLTAIAKGTVFSVETDGVRSRVRVYDGVVEVVQGLEHHLVAAGGAWTSDTRTLAYASERPAVLAADIAERLADRETVRVVAAAPPRSPPSRSSVVVATSTPPTQPPSSSDVPAHAPRSASADAMLADARAALAAGKLDDVLAIAERASRRGVATGEWLLVTADALRGLGRAEAAATTYQRAALDLDGPDAFEAAYSAAYLRFKEVKDPAGALTVLQAARVDSADSPLEERGLALHVRILQALDRTADARPIAERYVARYPSGELAAEMQRLANAVHP